MALTRYAQSNIYNISSSFTGSLPVEVTNIVTVTGSVASAITFPSSMDVVVTNFPAVQTVTGSVTINNPVSSVTVSNFPSTQTVTGTIHFDNTSIEVSNIPVTQSVYISNPTTTVAVSNFPADQTINGTVSVSNLPVTQSVYVANQISSVTVSNLPTTQSVFIANNPTVNQGTSPWVITGSVASSIVFPESMNVVVVSSSNLQTITGSVTINNPVSSVSVSNLPVTQSIKIDESILLPVSVSNLPVTQSVFIGGYTTSAQNVSMSNQPTVNQGISGSLPWKVLNYESETYSLIVTSSAIANGKSMASIFNASANIIKIQSVKIINVATGALAGVHAEFRFLRMTGHTGGTLCTPVSFDTANSLDANVTCRTGATISGEAAAPMLRYIWSSDDFTTASVSVGTNERAFQNTIPVYQVRPYNKPITLRTNEGWHIKQQTNSTGGLFDIEIMFTEDTI